MELQRDSFCRLGDSSQDEFIITQTHIDKQTSGDERLHKQNVSGSKCEPCAGGLVGITCAQMVRKRAETPQNIRGRVRTVKEDRKSGVGVCAGACACCAGWVHEQCERKTNQWITMNSLTPSAEGGGRGRGMGVVREGQHIYNGGRKTRQDQYLTRCCFL